MKNKSLQTTFITAFILFIAIPIILINILLNNTYKETFLDNYSDQLSQSLTQLKVGLEDEVKRISLATSVVANDEELMNLFEKWHIETDVNQRFALSQIIDRQLNYLFSFSSDVNALIVFFEDNSYYYYRRDLNQSVDEIKTLEWYRSSKNNQGMVHMIGYGESITDFFNLKTLSAAITPKPITIENSIDLIYIDTLSPMLKALEQNANKPGRYMLVDGNGWILADSSNDKQYVSTDTITELSNLKFDKEDTINEETTDYYLSKLYIKKLDWYILYMVPISETMKNIKQFLSVFYIIYILVVVSFSVYIITFYKGSILPIRHLVNKMKMVNKGHLDVVTEVTGPSEIRELSTTFNIMMKRINKLIQQRDEKERERSAEEIKALQAQINPHFIYNTLNSIKLMAMMTKANNIKNMLEAFMKVIELTFKSRGTLLTLKQELEYLEAYVFIMKVRYGSFFEINYDIRDDANDLYMMKMLLQPFIENAIIHGLQDKEDGYIKVSALKEQEKLVISIYDNGVGIKEVQINELLNRKSNDLNHIGISNVKRRIELTYGEGFTVEMMSEVGSFTEVIITLPIIDHIKE